MWVKYVIILNMKKSYIHKLTDCFCDTLGFERSLLCTDIVDNGAKSPKSILSKVKRSVYLGETSYTLGQMNDLSRCALILPQYKDALPVIQQLSNIYPSLEGHISRHTTGYIGVHLNFLVDKIPVEVQISTSDAWLVKQASEHVYRKHREFEAELPISINIINKQKNPNIRQELINNLKNSYEEYKRDYNKIRILFEELHRNTDLYENIDKIEAYLLSCNIKHDKDIYQRFDYDRILEQRLTDADGKVLEGLVIDNAKKLQPVTNNIQQQLVENVHNTIKSCLIKKHDFESDELYEFVFESIKTLRNRTLSIALNNFNDEKIRDLNNYLKREVNSSVMKLALYLQSKKIPFPSGDVEHFIEVNVKELIENNVLLSNEELVYKIENVVSKMNEVEKIVGEQ